MENTLDVREIVAQQRAAFLPHVDIRELHRRISEFRCLNFSAMSQSRRRLYRRRHYMDAHQS